MTPVRFWVKPIINRCYDAVLSSQGNGELASEKFRAILLCMQGQHTFDKVSYDETIMNMKFFHRTPPSSSSRRAPIQHPLILPYTFRKEEELLRDWRTRFFVS